MEPLSCAASVIAVIQLAGGIAEICGGYINKVKSAKQDILDLRQEIRHLEETLKLLDKLLRGPDGKKLAALQELCDGALKCSSILKHLSDKIDPSKTQSSPRRWGLRALKWPLTRKEVDEAIDQIERYKTLFGLALHIDHARATDRMERKLDLTQLKIADGATFDSYENKHAECLAGTRSDLLRHIEQWAESSNGKCIFWLNGMAGTGKSTISQTVASQLNKKRSLGASFFFKRGEEGRGNAKRLFPTLIQQLVGRIPQLAPSIQKVIDDDLYISEKSLGEQFKKLLFQPLLHINLDQPIRMVVVIDALDECESQGTRDDIRTILQFLPQVQTSPSIQLRFFLTSRPELPIRLGFRDIAGSHQDLDLHEISKPEIEHDISLFLKYRLSEIQGDRSLPINWPGKANTQTLITMSIPLFIFAATICRILEDDQWNPMESLSEILTHQTDNSKLDGTYLPVLNRVLLNQVGTKKTQLVKEYQKLLGTIIILESPLSITSLSALTGIPLDIIQLRLNALHSVLSIPTGDTKPVRLFHLSFRDYLLDPNTRNKTPLWIHEKETHKFLTKQCLSIMKSGLKKNICNLPSDNIHCSEVDIQSINHHLPPELQYACRYWAEHLTLCQEPVSELFSAFSVLKVHLLHWVEAMSVLGLTSEVVGIIERLQPAIQNNKDPKLSDFFRDARRFILKNHHLAEIAPLQLYSSGLIFCPQHSIIRDTYINELLSWNLLPKVEASWSAELQTLEGHSNSVLSVTFSPDAKQLASSSHDNTIKLWDPTTGKLYQTLEGHSNSVLSVTFSPDGQQLASCSHDHTIKLWDPTTGKLHQTLKDHSHWVLSVTFSPDGRQLASSSYDHTIKLWDPTTGELNQTLEDYSNSVLSLTFSPDGRQLASGSDDHTIKLWDPTMGELCQTLKGHSDPVLSLTFSPDGRQLASCSHDHTIKLWNPTTGKLHQTLEGHSDSVLSVAFSSDGKQLASCSHDHTIKLWDPTTGKLRQTLEGHSDWVRSVTFSPDGRLTSSSHDNTIKLWDTSTGELHQTLEGHSSLVWSKSSQAVSIFDHQWICLQGEKILWLPPGYRPSRLKLNKGILALGLPSGRVSFISKLDVFN